MKPISWLFGVALTYLAVGAVCLANDFGEELASMVCKNSDGGKNQLTSLDEIHKVVDYLSDLSSSHKLYECAEKYLESLEQLIHVVETAQGDVCGQEKLYLLEDYHRRFISEISKHEKERKNRSKAPKLVKLFFMQFASRVSSVCERAALEAIKAHGFALGEDEMAMVESMRNFTDILGVTDFSNGYDDTYLFWNMVDSLNLHKTDRFAKYLVEDGSENRLNLQMKRAEELTEVQAICRNKLKQVYSNTILPVLRLVDMGYNPESTGLIAGEGAPRDLLYATQICETLLPVGIYMNEKLDQDEVVALTKDEASQLSLYKPLDPHEASTQTQNPLEVSPSSLSGAELNFAGAKFDKVKASVSSRGHIMLSMLKRMVRRLKTMKSAVKGFKLLERDANKRLQSIDEDRLEEMAEQSLQVYEKSETGLARRKREFITICSCIAVINLCLALYALFSNRNFREKWERFEHHFHLHHANKTQTHH